MITPEDGRDLWPALGFPYGATGSRNLDFDRGDMLSSINISSDLWNIRYRLARVPQHVVSYQSSPQRKLSRDAVADKNKPPGTPVKRAVIDTPSPEAELKDDITLSIRIARELRDVLYEEARASHRSINGMITMFIEAGLGEMNKWPPGAPPKEPEPRKRSGLDVFRKGKPK
jgi:hypothetical protein